MFNIDNYGVTSGRLVSDPQIYDNADGSRKVRITIAAANNYKNRDGSRSSQFLPLEDFIPSRRARKGNGVYDLMHQGDKVTVQYTVRNNNYTRDNGEQIYNIVLHIDSVRLDETKAITEARQAAKAAGTETEKPEAETPAKSGKSGRKAA